MLWLFIWITFLDWSENCCRFCNFILLIWVSLWQYWEYFFNSDFVILYLSIIKPKIDSKSTKNTLIVRENLKSINEVFGSIKDLKILMKEGEIFNEFRKNVSKFEKNVFFPYFWKITSNYNRVNFDNIIISYSNFSDRI